MSTIDRFENDTVVHALAAGEDPAILAALAHGPFDGARDAWAACAVGDNWDRGDAHGSAIGALFALCDLLRAWESPEWGNTGGRYGHEQGAGGLCQEEWDALEAGTFDDAPDDETHEYRRNWEAIYLQGAHDYLQESPAYLADVVHLGDMLSQVIDQCRENGSGY